MTKFQAIRNTKDKYGNSTSTKRIIKLVKEEYGLDVSAQNVNSAIGSQKKRRLLSVDGGQFHEAKQFINKSFGGDVDLCFEVFKLIRKASI